MTKAVLGIIGGSGIYDLPGLAKARQKKVKSPWGEPSAPLRMGEIAGTEVVFLSRHDRGHRLSPSDITIRRNHVWKDPSWKGVWLVKNLFELKNARRVLVDGNVLEYNWPHAQNGFAILFTVRNQDGASPWSTVEDVIFQNNLVQHVASAVNILGSDDIHPSQPTRRIAILNNLFVDVGHGSNGWTQACGCGRIVADVVSGRAPEIDLEGFGVGAR